jgi:hypothetical protein
MNTGLGCHYSRMWSWLVIGFLNQV